MRLPKALNSSERAFHRVGAAAKNALPLVVFLVLLGRSSSKGPFIFYEVRGGWWDFGGVTQKKRLKRGGHPQKKRRKGVAREIF